jgi:bilirubin oxidase
MNSPLNGMNYNILKINIKPPTTNPVTSVPSSLVTVVKLKLTNVNTTRRIEFTPKANPTPMEAMDGPFFFNGESFKMNRVDQKIRLGNTEVWKLVNKTMVAHPFHIHDVQFFILDINGVPPTIDKQGRKDVVSVGPKDSIRFITKFDDFYGTTPFMYHCHNLMHEDGGMMGQFIVDNSASLRGDILGSEFNIYPNPALDQITIGNTKNIEINKIRLFSAVGEEVISEDINNSSSSIKLNLGKNKSGIYILHIITPNTSITKNIIIE